MPGKSTEGFTKVAQRQKFIRHRDIKLTGREIQKEENILQKTSEGICRRCREKVQWRFQYDKYKPLTAMAICRDCNRKCITRAYRSFCESCAASKGVCQGCCKQYLIDANGNQTGETAKKKGTKGEKFDEGVKEEAEGEVEEEREDEAAKRRSILWRSVCGGGDKTTRAHKAVEVQKEGELVKQEQEDEEEEQDDEEEEEQDDDYEEQEQEDEDIVLHTKMEKCSILSEAGSDSQRVGTSAFAVFAAGSLPAAPEGCEKDWDEKKFLHIAAMKYSKNRVVGAADDVMFNFTESKPKITNAETASVSSAVGSVSCGEGFAIPSNPLVPTIKKPKPAATPLIYRPLNRR